MPYYAPIPDSQATDASDYATIEAAVTAANSAGRELYVKGSHAATGNIANLFDIKLRGNGTITRSGNTFYVTPKTSQTNTLYVATTGSDTNDGLTSALPLLTIQKAADIINEYADGGLMGRWVIQLAAGTYAKVAFDSALRSEYPITLQGPATTIPWSSTLWIANAATNRVDMTPTAIIDGGAAPDGTGIYVDRDVWVIANYIKVTGFSAGDAVLVNSGDLTLGNVHCDNCLNGIVNIHGGFVGIDGTKGGGHWDGNALSGSIGYNALYSSTHNMLGTTLALAPLFDGGWEEGLHIGEGCQGHLDYTRVHDCTIAGVYFSRGSGACNTKQMEIYRNAVGVLARNAGWMNNGIDFGTAGNVNTVNVRALGGSPEFYQTAYNNSGRTFRVLSTSHDVTTSGTTQTTLFTSPSIASCFISEAGTVSRIIILGTATTLTGTCTLRVYINNGSDDYIEGIIMAAAAGNWKLEVELYYSAANAQRGFLTLTSANGVQTAYGTGALTLKNIAHTLRVTAQNSITSDVVTTRHARFETNCAG